MSNLAKVKSDIADLKDKKQALTQAVQNDIDAVQAKIDKDFHDIGKSAYDLHTGGNASMDTLASRFTIIDEYKTDQKEKMAKIAEIASRYDEEIQLLEKLVEDAGPEAFCSSCGKAYALGTDVFCADCGNKLPTGNEKNCAGCGLSYTPGQQAFCANCGNKH
ncbi:MAG: hypothetical protein FWE44_00755 [Defluviitaleaceae bacterium]|nr:hypothetical protein [Defluviitaleaceae bacterium]